MDSPNPLPRAHDRKPDPSEPWRYVCPECHGQVQGMAESQRFICKDCGTTWSRGELHDKKPMVGGAHA